MKYKKYCGKTVVGWLNIIFLQWFFVRLAYGVDGSGNMCGFNIIKWIVPLTGWWNNYIWIGKRK